MFGSDMCLKVCLRLICLVRLKGLSSIKSKLDPSSTYFKNGLLTFFNFIVFFEIALQHVPQMGPR